MPDKKKEGICGEQFKLLIVNHFISLRDDLGLGIAPLHPFAIHTYHTKSAPPKR